ncbi:type VII secretion protein EccB [Streptomyces sp. NPDC048483]|uniref:type VII secretion protein EccB n=1 Tax=Streptomyces sp. NPDC048483 TaxID=3154927 RepID=UPI0034440BA9
MASRRDELNAYSFARKRTNAAFLKPLPNGSIESAPKPLKAVVPSIIVSVLMLVGFGACGILKPVAPQGWDKVGGNVLVGDKSTTRYVVLDDTANGKHQKLLHPVLNLASARLLLNPDNFTVLKVDEKQLDGKISHGPAVGIPFAPDRLPAPEDVDKPKTWAVCNRPGSSSQSKPQQAVFVLGGDEKKKVETREGKLDLNQALYVKGPDEKYYLVNSNGVKFEFDATFKLDAPQHHKPMSKNDAKLANEKLRRMVFHGEEAQQVTQQWLDTLITSPLPIFEPEVPGAGMKSQAPANAVPDNLRTVGTVVEDSASGKKYVVTQNDVEKVSDFIANMLRVGKNADAVNHGSGRELQVESLASGSINPASDEDGREDKKFYGKFAGYENPWPDDDVSMANTFKGTQTGLPTAAESGVSCSVYKGTTTKFEGSAAFGYPNGVPVMGAWVGKDYPAKIAPGSNSYVTPGSGLLYREAKTARTKKDEGSLFLVTDTGLRYSVPTNNDGDKAGKADQEVGQNQMRLGYKDANVPSLMASWSQLLSAGPALNYKVAKQPQAS